MTCQQMGEMMGGMMSQMGGNMMWGGTPWIGFITLAVILIVGLALAVALGRRQAPSSGEDAREILRRRFARGELSAEEYAAAQRTLSQS